MKSAAMYRYMLLIAFLACQLWSGAQGISFTRPCSEAQSFPPLWLNSTTQSTRLIGNEFTVYSNMPNGSPYMGTWQRLRWYEVQELALVPATNDPSRLKCPTRLLVPEAAEDLLLRALDFDNTCMCTVTTGTRMFKPGISEDFIDLFVTRSDWPDFSLSLNFSLVNQSWSTIVPASPETFMLEYPLNWTASAPKVSFQINNWNWTTVGVANSSLRLYFLASTSADEDTTLIHSETKEPFVTFTTNTSNTFFETTFLRAFQADGVDFVVTATPDPDEEYVITKNSPQLIPFAVSLCHAAQPPEMTYSNMFYDPSIIALFSGAFEAPTESTVPLNKKNKPLNPAAYAVPIVIAAIIIGAVAVTVFVPSVRRKIRGDTDSLATLRGSKAVTQHSIIPPVQPDQAIAPTTPATQEKPAGGWARSERPQEPI